MTSNRFRLLDLAMTFGFVALMALWLLFVSGCQLPQVDPRDPPILQQATKPTTYPKPS